MLLKVSKLFLYASLFSIVVVLTTTFFPFIGGKYFFFRVAIELAIMFFLLWWAFEDKHGEALHMVRGAVKKPLFIAVSIFALTYLLSALFAYDPHAAFWSNYERGEGAFQMLHYYAFFVLLTFLMKTDADWRRVFKYAIMVGVLMVLYGVGSMMHWEGFVGPYGNETGSLLSRILSHARFQGSLGNPAYVAPYLMFSIFYALWLWFTGPKPKKLFPIIFYGGLILFFLFFLFLSETRGTIIGLGVAFVVFVGYLIWAYPKARKWAFAAIALVAIVFGTLYHYKDTAFVQRIPGSRVLDTSFSTQSFQTRFWTWGSALKGLKDRPLLGWGPENFSAVFDKHFDSRHFKPGVGSETWFDRAHSILFDALAETGIVGTLAYISIFALLYIEFFRRYLRRKGEYAHSGSIWETMQKGLLIAIPIGYVVQGLALFDTIPTYINVFFFLAFATYILYRPHHELSTNNK
ncbi:MAG: O-antigen ligase family protein [bacterium]|nr:O-antigen ligase family protein [bacterium]